MTVSSWASVWETRKTRSRWLKVWFLQGKEDSFPLQGSPEVTTQTSPCLSSLHSQQPTLIFAPTPWTWCASMSWVIDCFLWKLHASVSDAGYPPVWTTSLADMRHLCLPYSLGWSCCSLYVYPVTLEKWPNLEFYLLCFKFRRHSTKVCMWICAFAYVNFYLK